MQADLSRGRSFTGKAGITHRSRVRHSPKTQLSKRHSVGFALGQLPRRLSPASGRRRPPTGVHQHLL